MPVIKVYESCFFEIKKLIESVRTLQSVRPLEFGNVEVKTLVFCTVNSKLQSFVSYRSKCKTRIVGADPLDGKKPTTWYLSSEHNEGP